MMNFRIRCSDMRRLYFDYLIPHCDLDLEHSNPFWTLHLTYHQTKFGCKSISNSEDTVQAATFWSYKPCDLDLEDSKLDSGSCWCTTIPSLIINGWEVQKILSGFYMHRWDTHTNKNKNLLLLKMLPSSRQRKNPGKVRRRRKMGQGTYPASMQQAGGRQEVDAALDHHCGKLDDKICHQHHPQQRPHVHFSHNRHLVPQP